MLPSTLADKTCQVLSEILKIVFNLTVDWTVDEDDNVRMIILCNSYDNPMISHAMEIDLILQGSAQDS